MVEGQEVCIYSDLCTVTLRRHREFKFLTNKLAKLGLPYRWGFHFKLIGYQRNMLLIKALQQARNFEIELDRGG